MDTLFAISNCFFQLCYRIPFAFILYFSTPASEQKQNPLNLKQRLAASYIKTIVETLPLWLIRSIFDLTGVIEQLANGMYDGEERDKWCRRLKGGDKWDGYLIAENAETDDVGENADMVILYVHGGGLNAGGALISLVVFVKWIEAWKLSHGANTHIVSLEYGLSPEHPFPSARDSLLECYQWLVNEKGINPSKLTIAGDSVGGNLATLAALELLNNPIAYNNTPLPSRLLLISPCVSALTTSRTFETNYDNDCISMGWFDLCLTNSLLNSNLDPACPQVSPLFDCRLRGLPKVWVCVGGYEVFLEDIMSFVRNAKNQGVSVELVVEQDNMHNYAILFPLSRHGGAQKAIKYMSRFLFGEKSVIDQKLKD
ncbi:Alpha/Beta hydrolase protein [Gigaspora rosea]|uniref:Alpha/Beta hydrolase protein n=1 Tax=Gigaspora rosea TaxID=44941 RepID=A0A397TWN5_9GLOM|nr:Alpha/Beta hydrolase protein [Gigaspora rosea]